MLLLKRFIAIGYLFSCQICVAGGIEDLDPLTVQRFVYKTLSIRQESVSSVKSKITKLLPRLTRKSVIFYGIDYLEDCGPLFSLMKTESAKKEFKGRCFRWASFSFGNRKSFLVWCGRQ